MITIREMRKLPEHRFNCGLVTPVASGKQPYIHFDRNDYTIPPELVRKPLTLVASEHQVRVLDGGTEVARHARSYDRGRRIEQPSHLRALAEHKRAARELRGRDRLGDACQHADAFLGTLAHRGGTVGHHTVRLIKLLDSYGAAELDIALAEALSRGSAGAESVEHICEQRARARKQPPPVLLVHDDPRVTDLRARRTSSPRTTRSARAPSPKRVTHDRPRPASRAAGARSAAHP